MNLRDLVASGVKAIQSIAFHLERIALVLETQKNASRERPKHPRRRSAGPRPPTEDELLNVDDVARARARRSLRKAGLREL